MIKSLLIAVLVALAAVISGGCGGGGASLSDGQIARDALISKEDLPAYSGDENGLPAEPCGPELLFEDAGGRVAGTRLLAFGDERVEEAVGVFADASAADAAYEELTATNHFKCIRTSIAEFNAGESGVEILPARALGLGDRDGMVRFLVLENGARVQSYADLEAIQSGRCVASVILLSEQPTPTDTVIEEMGAVAAEPLEDNCG